MAKSKNSVIINKTVSAVFAYVFEPANTPEWRKSFIDASRDMSTPAGLGMIVHQSMLGPGGRKFPGDYQITEFVENQSFSFHVIAGPAVRKIHLRNC